MMTDANSLDGRKLSLSAQKALHQRVIEADKKGIKRTQIAKTFGMSRQWVWKVLRAFVWTRKAVRDLIRREFGKEIAIRTISAYMKRWNMTLGIATRSCRCWQMA